MAVKRRVLIIDDEESVRDLLHSALTGEGFDVEVAADGLEGFQKAQQYKTDVILLDIMMPDIDGYEVLQRLRQEEKTRNIPVLVLTARADHDDRVLGLEAGAVDYVTKPFFLRELVARIRIHLQLKEYEEQLTQKNRELEEYSDLLLQLNARLEEMARRDELTGIGNRRALNEQLVSTHSFSRRYTRPYSIIIVDLDHFKNYNDLYGHQKGDAVLKAVADTIRSACRETDFVARYGGEEIVVLLRESGHTSSQRIAERIIQSIENLGIPHENNQGYAVVTASAGIATFCPMKNPDEDWEAVLKRSDEALYKAKNTGRNRVVNT